MSPRISLIVAHSLNRVIGRKGELPWRLSADLKRFKQLTMGHHLVMGRKTLDSIGRLLPGRTTIVLSRQSDYRPPACCEAARVVTNLPAAIALAMEAGDDEVYVIGGGEVYRLALPWVQRLYVTLVEAEVTGDTIFPALPQEWKLTGEERRPADLKNEFPFAFQVWERRGADATPAGAAG